MWIFLQRWVVQSWVKIIQGYCKSSFQILKLCKNILFSFFLSTIWWMDVPKRIGKIIPKRFLNSKMKKNWLQFNPGLLLISQWTTGPWSYIHDTCNLVIINWVDNLNWPPSRAICYDKGLMLETSAFKLFTVVNSCYQLRW